MNYLIIIFSLILTRSINSQSITSTSNPLTTTSITTVTSTANTYVTSTFSSKLATTTLLDCRVAPCRNNGTCLNFNSKLGYYCNCQPGYTGAFCAITDVCYPNPCNQGTCVQYSTTAAYCKCPKAYTGPLCENLIGCLSNPCLNNGICSATTSPPYYICACSNAYSGYNCNEVTNNITCQDSNSSSCQYFKSIINGFCSNNYYINGQSASVYCSETCGLCDLNPCSDLSNSCAYWNSLGYCNLFSVKYFCKKSCNLC